MKVTGGSDHSCSVSSPFRTIPSGPVNIYGSCHSKRARGCKISVTCGYASFNAKPNIEHVFEVKGLNNNRIVI